MMKTAAVVVTYDPPADFADHLTVWMSQLDKLIIVDNGSAAPWRDGICRLIQDRFPGVEFVSNESNLGIAASLNQGFEQLIEEGHPFAFVFDQDSVPAPGMVAEMVDVYRSYPGPSPLALVAPHVQIPAARTTSSFLVPSGPFLFRRVRCSGQRVLDNVSIIISSGALHDLEAFKRIGPFRNDFFIDYVDTDYCLRARERGYGIVVACRASLTHELGRQREGRFGPLTMHPTFHSPLRWYYISRNRVPMMLRYAVRFPYWFFYELLVNTYGLVRLVLFEDHKWAKLRAIALGTWDGLLNRMGRVSIGREHLLAPEAPHA